MITKLIGTTIVVVIFLFCFIEIATAAPCTGGTFSCYAAGLDIKTGTYTCNIKGAYGGTFSCVYGDPSCPPWGPCGNAAPYPCVWDSTCTSCSCDWGTWSICYSNWAGCIKDRACSCSPSGCGSCSGDNWTYCTASEKGCSNQDCPTYAGYPGGTVRDGTLSSDCSCGTKTCPAICNPSDPDTPVLSAPASGTTVNVNTSVSLEWTGISSWGTGCPSNTNTYEVCVSSTGTCDKLNQTGISESTTIQSWSPGANGGYMATWKVKSNNGSNTATSATRTLCVEDQLCTYPQCGEDRYCSNIDCPDDDLGVPGVPVISYPIGTALAPIVLNPGTTGVNLSLQGAASKADLYYYGIYDDGAYYFGASSTAISVGITGLSSGNLYSWRARSVNTTCIGTGETSAASNWGYFRVNAAPTIVKIQVANSDGTLVPNDNPTNNHICKSEFTVTTKPREVVFGIFVNDPDGVGDSGPPPVLHWNGIGYTTVWTGVGGGNNAAQARVDYASYVGDPPQPLHEVTATYSDRWGGAVGSTSPVLPANRLNWKVWNCEVPTYGTLYKAVDAVQNCSTNSSGVGFSDPIDVGVSFDSIIFSDTPDVAMSVLNASDYGPNSIVWGKTYLPFINGGNAGNIDGTLLATGRVTRMIDLGVGTTICPSNQFIIDNSTVSPYSASPRAQIDFSFIRDQEAWYQVEGAGVKSRGGLEYGVPVTAGAIKFLTLGNPTVYNGLVSATSFTNINGNNNENEFGSPNNWWINRNTNDLDIYNYNYFYNNFYVKAGVGETKTNSWGGWTTDKKIYFVNSHLDIDENLTVPSGQTVMVIVSGNITIQPNVTRLDGIYIADGSISAGGINGNQLEINGMLYAGDQVRFYRSYVVKRTNNTTPAVKVNYSPGLIFNLPTEIMKVLSGWREE